MLTRNILYYEARITFGLASFLPLLLLPGYTILGWIVWASRESTPSLDEAIRVFELLLALSGGLIAAHLMTIEREEGFDGIRRSYPEASWRVPLLRVCIALLFITISGFVAAGFFYMAHGHYSLNEVLFPALAPAFYLCSMALMVNNVSGNYWITVGVIIAYWYGEFASGGYYTQSLYLFNHSSPLADADPHLNRGLLIVGMMIFILLNTGYSMWRRRVGG